MLKGTMVEINENKYNITPGIQKVLVDQIYDTAKSMTDKDKIIFRDILQKTRYYNRKPSKSRLKDVINLLKKTLIKKSGKF